MIIRVLDEKKASICDNLLTKLIQDERQYDDFISEDFVVKDYFKNIVKKESNILLCNEDDNNINGYIFLKQINSNDRNGFLIDGLYVDEIYRNQGIATKLIDEAVKIIKNTNAEFIDINVLAGNEVARKLYKTFGFNEFKINLRKKL